MLQYRSLSLFTIFAVRHDLYDVSYAFSKIINYWFSLVICTLYTKEKII